MEQKVLTAPKAVIKINGYASGFMRNVRCTENIQRGEVKGISNLTLQEVPATGYTCQLTADFFFISLKRPEVQALVNRSGSVKEFIDTLILGEQPCQIHMYKKKKLTEVNNVVTEVDNEGETIAVVRDFFPDSQAFDITEGQISGTNITGRYLTPVIFNNS
ncbi:MAG TPA: hypothetical protein PK588_07665 [Paludibacteraceae bacterium]|nr:hypothetical protein [Paludibacteraceae bacterium]